MICNHHNCDAIYMFFFGYGLFEKILWTMTINSFMFIMFSCLFSCVSLFSIWFIIVSLFVSMFCVALAFSLFFSTLFLRALMFSLCFLIFDSFPSFVTRLHCFFECFLFVLISTFSWSFLQRCSLHFIFSRAVHCIWLTFRVYFRDFLWFFVIVFLCGLAYFVKSKSLVF